MKDDLLHLLENLIGTAEGLSMTAEDPCFDQLSGDLRAHAGLVIAKCERRLRLVMRDLDRELFRLPCKNPQRRPKKRK